MKNEFEADKRFFGVLNITYKHPEYGSHLLNLKDERLYADEDFFYLGPGYRTFGNHKFYMGVKFKKDLVVHKYKLEGNDHGPIWAQLEVDSEAGDKHASGTFELTRSGHRPKGDFNLFGKGGFEVEGDFEFYENRS
ncbi:hypothetical protein I1A_004856 [Pseudomonas fluorescens R124]|uniref:Uncharacterized protein n=1 Tax=Pseudomonas fluorescens R124 TaxID=743713 RepID=A0A7U9CRZ4_PSEFL|nr:hypothetical protein [Pseudomonas fluorescens]EJZ60491.1 hypothetical protein I1A_004856 [Pseudomonas fluorescens R124]